MLSGDFGAIDAIGIGPGMPQTYGILPITKHSFHSELHNSISSMSEHKIAYQDVDSLLVPQIVPFQNH